MTENKDAFITGLKEVWKGNMKAALSFLLIIGIGTVLSYLLAVDYWVIGVALIFLFILTMVMFTFAAGIWLFIALQVQKTNLSSKIVKFSENNARVLHILSIAFFVLPLLLLYLFFFTTPPSVSITAKVSGNTSKVPLKYFLLLFIVPLTVLIGSMVWDNI